jgi:hypothetical protein
MPRRRSATASRYALFTLVGISGGDDIDAPDLKALPPAPAGAKPAPNKHGWLNGSGTDRIIRRGKRGSFR